MSTSPTPALDPGRQRAKGTVTPKETDDAQTLQKPTQRELENYQLVLFQNVLCNTDQERDRISHAIELWDSTPRYSFNRKAANRARINGQFLEPRKLTFQYRGGNYTLTVSPARLEEADGGFRDYFPGATEELVEECLRKLAIENNPATSTSKTVEAVWFLAWENSVVNWRLAGILVRCNSVCTRSMSWLTRA